MRLDLPQEGVVERESRRAACWGRRGPGWLGQALEKERAPEPGMQADPLYSASKHARQRWCSVSEHREMHGRSRPLAGA